jgi:hypothetical protein
MTTIFCDFCQFSAKNWSFSQKPMLWSKLCLISLCFESKTPFFRPFFGENIYKIITSVPGANQSNDRCIYNYNSGVVVDLKRQNWSQTSNDSVRRPWSTVSYCPKICTPKKLERQRILLLPKKKIKLKLKAFGI